MPAPHSPPRSRRHGSTATRRAALAALLAATGGLVAWRWPHLHAAAVSTAPAAEGAWPAPGEDVCVAAPPTPFNPASGQALHAARDVPPDARCPVCGMFPARSRAWAAQVIFADGDAYFFDSPLSLGLYLLDVPRYTRGRSAGDIVARYVTDTDSGQWVDAALAVYVQGSSARGPMRAGNLPAFATQAAARQFAQQRGGQVVGLGDMDAALLRSMAPHRMAGHLRHPG
ncbi:nitrous oxide reductase accessory protein NosL [Acidovorax sp. RAC01]|uniref:nitrous oxide reductase accessory protein NosL n=1 Tax=Acidovorax sp. RAC01 TaxID=1842533 RepID=UPI003FA41649